MIQLYLHEVPCPAPTPLQDLFRSKYFCFLITSEHLFPVSASDDHVLINLLWQSRYLNTGFRSILERCF